MLGWVWELTEGHFLKTPKLGPYFHIFWFKCSVWGLDSYILSPSDSKVQSGWESLIYQASSKLLSFALVPSGMFLSPPSLFMFPTNSTITLCIRLLLHIPPYAVIISLLPLPLFWEKWLSSVFLLPISTWDTAGSKEEWMEMAEKMELEE